MAGRSMPVATTNVASSQSPVGDFRSAWSSDPSLENAKAGDAGPSSFLRVPSADTRRGVCRIVWAIHSPLGDQERVDHRRHSHRRG